MAAIHLKRSSFGKNKPHDDPCEATPIEQSTPYGAIAQFVHPNSWNWINPDQLQEPPDWNIDEMCNLAVPVGQLYTPGQAPQLDGIEEVRKNLESKQSSMEVDPFFHSFLTQLPCKFQAISDKVHASPLDTREVPNEGVVHVLNDVEAISCQVAECLLRLEELDKADRTAAVEAAQARLQTLEGDDPPESDAMSLENGTEEAMAQGWEGSWWERTTREKVDEVLAHKVQCWAECEERDAVVDQIVQMMAAQFGDLQARISVLERLANPETLSTMADFYQGQLQDVIGDRRGQQRAIMQDLEAIERCIMTTKQAHDAAVADFAAAMAPSNALIEHLEESIRGLERLLQEKHEKYLAAKKALEQEESRIFTNQHSDRLRQEVQEMRRMVDQLLADIKAKEEEIRISDLKFETEHLAVERERIRTELARLDAQLEEDKRVIKQQLTDLKQQLEAAEKERSAQDQKEWERCLSVNALLNKLRLRADLLHLSDHTHGLAADYALLLHECMESLAAAMASYSHHARMAHRAGYLEAAACIDALTWACRLLHILQRAIQDKQQRVRSVDRTLVRHIRLLEFCVDTHDPNAHKHQAVINELERLRTHLEGDTEKHGSMQTTIHDRAGQVMRLVMRLASGEDFPVMDRLTQLRAQYSSTFEQLDQSGPSLPEKAPPPPFSRMVHCVGSPLRVSASRTALAAPFGPPAGAVAYTKWATSMAISSVPSARKRGSTSRHLSRDTAEILFPGDQDAMAVSLPPLSGRSQQTQQLKADLERLRQTLIDRSPETDAHALSFHQDAVKALSDLLAAELLDEESAPAEDTSSSVGPSTPSPRPASAPASTQAFSGLHGESYAVGAMADRRLRRQRTISKPFLLQSSPVYFDHQQFLKKGIS